MWIWVGAALLSAACGGGGPKDTSPPTPAPPVTTAKKCVVLLHGKGGAAEPGSVTGDTIYLRPGGNADGWGGRQWLYYPEDRYQQVRAAVSNAISSAGCEHAIIQGFSNGAAAAAKLYCRGERFDNRVSGYIIDDPVPDGAVAGCKPGDGVRVRLYWTGGLSVAIDGWSCTTQDWTCEGGRTIGIEKYGRALGTDVTKSIHTTHTAYSSPPEQTAWLAQGG
jgi:pimeloyl-ACP methyl ester carboxylesterase